MLKSILLAILVLLAVMPRCDQLRDECRAYRDSDCDDGNPCTKDVCGQFFNPGGAEERRDSWCNSQWRYYCDYSELDDGTPCEVDAQTGVCQTGECRPNDDASDGGA